jgi:cytidine deaminase
LEPWSATNCAEAVACSRVLASGSKLEDLTVVPVRTETGEIFPPCAN